VVAQFLTIAPVCDAILLNILFPHLTAVVIDELSDEEGVVRIRARASSDEARCPACDHASARVHCWYERQLADAPVAGRPVTIRLRVRKFICQTLGCARRIFVEQLAGLTVKHSRRSVGLLGLLVAMAFALAGRAGARLARRAAIVVSRSTLLRARGLVPAETAAMGSWPDSTDRLAVQNWVAVRTAVIPTGHSRLDTRCCTQRQ
jgi:hypothetical protein